MDSPVEQANLRLSSLWTHLRADRPIQPNADAWPTHGKGRQPLNQRWLRLMTAPSSQRHFLQTTRAWRDDSSEHKWHGNCSRVALDLRSICFQAALDLRRSQSVPGAHPGTYAESPATETRPETNRIAGLPHRQRAQTGWLCLRDFTDTLQIRPRYALADAVHRVGLSLLVTCILVFGRVRGRSRVGTRMSELDLPRFRGIASQRVGWGRLGDCAQRLGQPQGSQPVQGSVRPPWTALNHASACIRTRGRPILAPAWILR